MLDLSKLFGGKLSAKEELAVEAEVVCCQYPGKELHHKWVAFDLRHAGKRTPPQGVSANTMARCPLCLSGQDFAAFSGRTRVRD